ncbi:hypothetical protein BDY24DRAFT_431908 [Mrakia frigida]|uniref:uncharacterized protein n=1 Tax=Mrakia frigida TaxID=29902 RepID=UPI003FCC02AB
MLPYPATQSSSTHPKRSLGNYLTTSSSSTTSLSLSVGGGSLLEKRKVSELLRQRSRVTNLALVLILGLLGVSLVANFRGWMDGEETTGGGASSIGDLLPPKVIADTVDISEEMKTLSHLIVVAGHGIWTGHDASLREKDDQWLLEPYQRGGQTVDAIFKHIQSGSDLVLSDPAALLVFSGGQTRPLADQTEAQSYHHLATASSLLPPSFPRATTEDFALDSFQNLLFSIARFHEITSSYPSRITVVGFGVKEARFKELHRAALRFPEARFEYVGIDLAGDLTSFYEGERKNGYHPFTLDLYGCHPPLVSKRRRRNPFARWHPYLSSAPELKELLEFCPAHAGGGEGGLSGLGVVYEGRLPWDGR